MEIQSKLFAQASLIAPQKQQEEEDRAKERERKKHIEQHRSRSSPTPPPFARPRVGGQGEDNRAEKDQDEWMHEQQVGAREDEGNRGDNDSVGDGDHGGDNNDDDDDDYVEDASGSGIKDVKSESGARKATWKRRREEEPSSDHEWIAELEVCMSGPDLKAWTGCRASDLRF